MKQTIATVALIAALSGPTYAADLGGSLKDQDYGTAHRFSFTGFYTGITAGVGFGDTTFDADYNYSYSDGEETVSGGGNIISLEGLSAVGGRVGVDGEYLRDFGRLVGGVGGFWDYSGQEWNGSILGGLASAKAEVDDAWGLYLKGGVKVGPETLLYGLAGYGGIHANVSARIGDGESEATWDKDVNLQGFLGGVGIQHHLGDGWHLKAQATVLVADDEELFKIGDESENITANLGITDWTAKLGLSKQW